MRTRTLWQRAAVALATAGLVAAACGGGGTGGTGGASAPGVTSNSILIGGTDPLSGPAVAYGTIPKASDAYFKYVNDHGGVNGRKIVYQYLDDAYNPAQTVPLTKQLVEQNQVFLLFGGLGTQDQTAVRDYLNAKKVPQVFVATGATTFSAQFKQFPYTYGWQPSYQGEALIYAQYVERNLPNAKIGVIYQNDDYGTDYLNGLVKGLGSKASMIVDKQSNDVGAPDLTSQILHLKAAGADTLFVFETPTPAIKALVTAFKVSWKPTIFLNSVAAPVPYVMAAAKAAGDPAAVQGIFSVEYTVDPTDPAQASSAGVTQFKDIMQKYYPTGDVTDAFNVYGMATAYSLVDVLKKAGANPTRQSVLNALNSWSETNPFLLSGVHAANTPSDHYTITQELLAKYDGSRYVPQSQLIDVRGKIKFP